MTFLERLGLEHPVVQAGMGGGIAGGELAGAVSAAGGLGTVGILPPHRMAAELNRARELSGGAPVAANLLVPFTTRAHVEECRRAGAAAFVLHAGFDRDLIGRLRERGACVLPTVGTADEARRALQQGADGVVVQGREAGGHLVGVDPALDALERALRVAGHAPVLVAGGVADGADARRALEAGAAAVVAGTRFLLSDECAAHADYKRRVLAAERTIETQLFGFGWPMRHRVIPNAATDRWCKSDPMGPALLRAAQRLTTPLSRLPMSLVAGTVGIQRLAIPLFGPSATLEGMPDRLLDVTPLYAGETALRIDAVRPAAEVVRRLAGARSPTISPS